jgi:CDP-glycerol glycerophosphotransferase
MTSMIESEFLYTGDVLDSGYPRNDRLATATPDDAVMVRDGLGLPRTAKVLLYAPTFRENQRRGWRAELFDALDLDRLMTLLGPDWYVLLRGHSFNARNDQLDRSRGRLLDATLHPDVNDLYIAADALVTDYSSTMFDFAVTGKPMAFFTPDLEQYVVARGAYFDLSEVAPGPLYPDVAHLGDALRDLEGLATQFAGRYAAFCERFTPWDDGKAAARVVDSFFN